ncbi:hypothetical protein SASPL_148612 [Salvia splendens]|uniref:Protein FAR1-RELATED SEQUENCE n=1 Tax=Salvia splendens TaxID=180675 RepID=A0A8X8Z3J2_SALSN|nr:hypothetical protein SASPL_148612 [Salvia splendens]
MLLALNSLKLSAQSPPWSRKAFLTATSARRSSRLRTSPANTSGGYAAMVSSTDYSSAVSGFSGRCRAFFVFQVFLLSFHDDILPRCSYPRLQSRAETYIGQVFETLDEGISFYEAYANDCRFDNRRFGHKYSNGVKTWQTIVYSRQGEKWDVDEEGSSTKRRRRSSRCHYNVKLTLKCSTDSDNSQVDDKRVVATKLHSLYFRLFQRAQSNGDDIFALFDGMEEISQKFFGDTVPSVSSMSKAQRIENLCGSSRPNVVSVHPPNVVSTKGSHSTSGRRIRLAVEKAIILQNKPKRRCAKCREIGHHDARNYHGADRANNVSAASVYVIILVVELLSARVHVQGAFRFED